MILSNSLSNTFFTFIILTIKKSYGTNHSIYTHKMHCEGCAFPIYIHHQCIIVYEFYVGFQQIEESF